MEYKIKVGELIRTNDGRIYKLDDLEDEWYLNDKFYNNIVKHSENITDLIKAEDVVKIKIGLYSSFVHFIVDEDDLISIKTQIESNFWIIDKIYTKEMMESISYKVERKD